MAKSKKEQPEISNYLGDIKMDRFEKKVSKDDDNIPDRVKEVFKKHDISDSVRDIYFLHKYESKGNKTLVKLDNDLLDIIIKVQSELRIIGEQKISVTNVVCNLLKDKLVELKLK